MIVFGSNHFGKTDHLPGLFHVVTEFLHVYYLPLIPFSSFCMLDLGDGKQGVKIGISGKSILMGYFRGWFGIIGTIATIVFLFSLFIDDPKKPREISFHVLFGVILAIGWTLFYLSYRWQKPAPARALYLANKLGIPMNELVEHYLDDPRIEVLMVQSQSDETENDSTKTS